VNKQQVREHLEVTYVPAPTTTMPVCGKCGAALAENLIEQHHSWHTEQDKRN
jgi:hypothetical protein